MLPVLSIASSCSGPCGAPCRHDAALRHDDEGADAPHAPPMPEMGRSPSQGSRVSEQLLPQVALGRATLREPLLGSGQRSTRRTAGLARKVADMFVPAGARGAAASAMNMSTAVLRQVRSTTWRSAADSGADEEGGFDFGLGPEATWWEQQACATERLLLGQRHGLERFEPYARLLLDVTEARSLIACDPGGKSDPYVQVYVNDVLHDSNRDNAQWRSLEPRWDFRVEIPIYSPFTIVRVTVMDRDRVGSDDFMGFVELRVADLEPDGRAVAGWFELRMQSMLLGKASHRFRRHRRTRDDTYSLQDEPGEGVAVVIPSEASCPGLDSPRASLLRQDSQAELPTSPTHSGFNRHSLKSLVGREWSTGSIELGLDSPTKRRPFSGFSLPGSLRCARCLPRCSPCKGCTGRGHDDAPPPKRSTCRSTISILPSAMLGRAVQSSRPPNAGEIRMRLDLRIEAPPEPMACDALLDPAVEAAARGLPSEPLLMFTAAFRPRSLLQVCPDPEWRACCFPYPTFLDTSSSREQETASMQDIKDFYDVCIDLKGMVFSNLFAPALAVFLFVISWQDSSLSMLVLVYWCFVCLFPFFWLPSLPLVLAFWVLALRSREFWNSLLLHEELAPLSPEGFEMLSKWNNSKKITVWLRRLIKDRGGWVTRGEELQRFAHSIHKDGEPLLSFASLIAELNSGRHRWITWSAGVPKRCQRGHVMECLGSGAFRLDDDGWRCAGISGCRPCLRRIHRDGLHFGAPRYRCSVCDVDFCGSCAIGGRKTNFLLEVPMSKFGLIPFARVMEVVHGYADLVEDSRDVLRSVLSLLGRIFEKRHRDLARKIYLACGASSAAVAVLQMLLWTEVLGSILRFLWRCMWVAGGALLLLQRSAPVRRATAARKAMRDLIAIRNMRARGGLGRWSFFREESLVG